MTPLNEQIFHQPDVLSVAVFGVGVNLMISGVRPEDNETNSLWAEATKKLFAFN